MWKRLVLALAASGFALVASAVDINKGNAQDLTAIKGIGPALSERIVAERKNGNFKNWDDVIARVKGVGETAATKLSANGLTVNGGAYKTAAAAAKDAKPPAKPKAEPAKKQ